MSVAEPYDRRRCPVCTADAARLLLSTGRASMAVWVPNGLPDLIEDAIAKAWANGVAQGHAAAREVSQGHPPEGRPVRSRRQRARLRIADELAGARRAALLGVGLDDLRSLLEGRAGVGWGALDRVRRVRQ